MSKHFLRQIADKLPLNYLRIAMNFWPPFIGTGIKVNTISDDFRLVKTSVKLHWYNKNLVGTHFGGTIFAMTDAFYMIMLIRNLGENYIVWDKRASIEFKKPGRSTLYATFQFTIDEIENIRKMADSNDRYIFDKTVDVHDAEDNVIATVVKTIYVRHKK